MEKNKITGDYLADSLNCIILSHKIQVIKEKFMDFKRGIDLTSVDIPEFCKPKDEQFETIVNNFIQEIINTNTIEYYYSLAISNV